MKAVKLILLFVALILLATPGTLIFITALVILFQKEFASTIVCLVISLPVLYGAKMCLSRIDKIKHPEKYPEKKNEKTEVLEEKENPEVVIEDSGSENIEMVENPPSTRERGYEPEYEIRYVTAEGYESVRQIYIHAFKGRYISAYCFLRHEDRTFTLSHIIECIDLKTGELITENLHLYFNKKFHTNFKLEEMF